jgi:serine/threonine-protein kinase
MGDYASAEPLFRESLALRRKLLKPDDLIVVRAEHNLARLLTLAGKLTEAAPLIDHAEVVRRAKLPADHPDLARTVMLRADWLRRNGDLAHSRELVGGLESAHLHLPPLAEAQQLELAGRLAEASGDKAQALSDFEQAYTGMRTKRGADHPLTAEFGLYYADALFAAQRADEANKLVLILQPIVESAYVEQSPQRRLLNQLRHY